MSGFRFSFDVAGDVQIDRELMRVGDRALDPRPAFRAIANLMIAETEQQFESEGRHASGGWRPLAPSTVLEKQAGGYRPQILQRTGSLLASLTEPGDANMVLRTTPSLLEFGTKLPYGEFHQKGTARMPQRRPLEFTEGTRRGALKILQRYFHDGSLPG